MIRFVRKRSGDVVLFDLARIETAIKKSFQSQDNFDFEEVLRCTEKVLDAVQAYTSKHQTELISVEDTQDIVEDVLIQKGHVAIAKSYIRYRTQRALARQDQTLDQISKHDLHIIQDDQSVTIFEQDDLLESLADLTSDLPFVNLNQIVSQSCLYLYDNISQKDYDRIVLNSIRDQFENHHEYSKLAARYVLRLSYQRIFGGQSIEESYKKLFPAYLQKGIDLELISPVLQERFDLEQLAQEIQYNNDDLFYYLGLQTLEDRYLLRDRTPERLTFELPQWMWMRVAMGVAQKEDHPTQRAIEFYHQLSSLNYLSSTPTLFNSGTLHSQMSSCYINTVPDSLSGIFDNYSECASLSKWAGGIGTDWTPVRSTGSLIKGTNGLSQGIIPFIKLYNDLALAVNQGGKRKGAMAAYLEVWHKDIDQFLELRKNTGDERRRAHDINTVVWVPDLFMQRVQREETWTLFCPSVAGDLHDLYGREFEERYLQYEKEATNATTIPALTLWRKILSMNFEAGGPWITFKDPINVRSPQDHCGRVYSSNLCTEITLNTSDKETAVCNLGSVNLSHMIVDGKLDTKLLAKTVRTAVRMLDNVIDNNFYPSEKAEYANLQHRPIGLGVMGFQDALFKMEIPFEDARAFEFADSSMELISYHAILASSELAQEKGSYQSYEGSKWSRGLLPIDTLDLLEKERGEAIDVSRTTRLNWDYVRETVLKQGMRNSNVMAIAPTATIANISGVVPCVEPIFRNIYMKENLSGNFLILNRFLVDKLIELNLWSEDLLNQIKMANGSIQHIQSIPESVRKLFLEAFEVSPLSILQQAALRCKWIDQAASTNIFISTSSGSFLHNTYFAAWKMGLKTTYYMRSQGASQVTKTISVKSQSVEQGDSCSIEDPSCEVCQ